MLRIFIHTEQLLLSNDCVIIPEFGGFVLRTRPAVYKPSAHTFGPPRKEITFNTALKHNDELLTTAYMQSDNLNFREAQTALKKDVEVLKAELERRSEVSADPLGTFRKNNNGKLTFHPGAENPKFSVKFYGLSTLYLPPIKAMQPAGVAEQTTEPAEKSARVIYFPIHRAIFRFTGMTAVALALFLFISTPIEDVNPDAYTAGVIPSERILQEKTTPAEPPKIRPALPAKPKTETTPAVSPFPPKPTTTTPAVPPSPPKPTTTAVEQRTYYVIVGSFESETQARRFLSALDPVNLKNTGVVQFDSHFRVYADKSGDRKEAIAYRDLLRTKEEFKNAWLFIGR